MTEETPKFATVARIATAMQGGMVVIIDRYEHNDDELQDNASITLEPLLEEAENEDEIGQQFVLLTWNELKELSSVLVAFIEASEISDEDTEKVDYTDFNVDDIVYISSYELKGQIEEIDLDDIHETFFVRFIDGYHNGAAVWVPSDGIRPVTD